MRRSARSIFAAVFAALVTVVLASATAHATAPLSGADLAKYQDCTVDTDCVYAQNGSCDCNNGGTGVAVNKAKLEDFLKNFEPAECTKIKGASCTTGLPRCERNTCIYYARIIPHVYTGKKPPPAVLPSNLPRALLK